ARRRRAGRPRADGAVVVLRQRHAVRGGRHRRTPDDHGGGGPDQRRGRRPRHVDLARLGERRRGGPGRARARRRRMELRRRQDRDPRVHPGDARDVGRAARPLRRGPVPRDRGGRAQRRRRGLRRRPAGGPGPVSARTEAVAVRARDRATARPAVRRGPRPWLALPVAAAVLVLSVGVAVTIGPADLALTEVARSVTTHLGLGGLVGAEPLSALRDGMVWQLRMPRILTAAAVGAGLALCGAVMQSLTRNPLADPYLLGLSSGASLGAVLVLLAGVPLLLP